MTKRDLRFVEVDSNKMYVVYEGKKMVPVYTITRKKDGMWQTHTIAGAKHGRANRYRNDIIESLKCDVTP